jgi:acid stress chaperone HdeA
MMMKNVAVGAMALGVLLSSGCSASKVINTGGDTRCKDFVEQDEKKQDDEISKMLKDKSGADPSNLEISATRLSVSTYCKTVGTPDSKISEAPHG